MVAVPAPVFPLDERVHVCQVGKHGGFPVPASDLAGKLGVDPVEDAGAQQEAPDVRRLGVEHLLHQVAGDGAVLRDEFLDELIGVGVTVHRDRGQAQDRRPALGPPGEPVQRLLRQPDAVLRHEQAGFLGGEG